MLTEVENAAKKEALLREIGERGVAAFRSFFRDDFDDDTGIDLPLSSNFAIVDGMVFSADGATNAIVVSKKIEIKTGVRILTVYCSLVESVTIEYSLDDGVNYAPAVSGTPVNVPSPGGAKRLRLRGTIPPGGGLLAWGASWEIP